MRPSSASALSLCPPTGAAEPASRRSTLNQIAWSAFTALVQTVIHGQELSREVRR